MSSPSVLRAKPLDGASLGAGTILPVSVSWLPTPRGGQCGFVDPNDKRKEGREGGKEKEKEKQKKEKDSTPTDRGRTNSKRLD